MPSALSALGVGAIAGMGWASPPTITEILMLATQGIVALFSAWRLEAQIVPPSAVTVPPRMVPPAAPHRGRNEEA